MGQLWAAIRSLGVIADLIRETLQWVREYLLRRELDAADATHDKNAADIDAAFIKPVMRVPEPAADQPGPAAPDPSAVPGSKGSGP